MNQDNLARKVWPKLNTYESAAGAARQGLWAAIALAALPILALGLLFSMETLKLSPDFALLNIPVFTAAAIGFKKSFRPFALAGLVWHLFGICYFRLADGQFPTLLSMIVLLMLVNGVRGVFAIHKLPEPADST